MSFPRSAKGTPANTSSQEQALRVVIDAWARARFGADVRIIHELVLGDRRIDMLIVGVADLVGVEVKGPKDKLDERLKGQLRTFQLYLPEVWLAVDAKWRDSNPYRWCGVNRLVIVDGVAVDEPPRERRDAIRDDLCCSRLLELLWSEETLRIAKRTECPVEYMPGKYMPIPRIKSMLARMLTGHKIVKEVCLELRSRPLTGMASDAPLDRGASVDGDGRLPPGPRQTIKAGPRKNQ